MSTRPKSRLPLSWWLRVPNWNGRHRLWRTTSLAWFWKDPPHGPEAQRNDADPSAIREFPDTWPWFLRTILLFGGGARPGAGNRTFPCRFNNRMDLSLAKLCDRVRRYSLLCNENGRAVLSKPKRTDRSESRRRCSGTRSSGAAASGDSGQACRDRQRGR